MPDGAWFHEPTFRKPLSSSLFIVFFNQRDGGRIHRVTIVKTSVGLILLRLSALWTAKEMSVGKVGQV